MWWWLHVSVRILKTTELFTLNAGIMWCMNYISIKLLLIYIYVFSQLPLCSPSQHAEGLIVMWSLSSWPPAPNSPRTDRHARTHWPQEGCSQDFLGLDAALCLPLGHSLPQARAHPLGVSRVACGYLKGVCECMCQWMDVGLERKTMAGPWYPSWGDRKLWWI